LWYNDGMKNWLKELKNLFRKYWWAVVIAVIIVTAGALISVFSSYWLCRYILNFFDDWSIALSAGAAVILALAAFLTIRHSKKQENRRRKAELLNEIIEWATNILRLNSDLFDFTESVRLEMSGISSQNIKKLYSDTVASKDKGKYIKITTRAACNNASDAVIRLQDELSKIANLLGGFIVRNEIVGDVSHLITTEDAMGKDRDERQDTVEKHRRKIALLCNLIIEEATKIKTRDIG